MSYSPIFRGPSGQNVADPTTNHQVATKNYVDSTALENIPQEMIRWVDAVNGSNTTGTGSASKPFATIAKAQSDLIANGASEINFGLIQLTPGSHHFLSTDVFGPHIFISGCADGLTYLFSPNGSGGYNPFNIDLTTGGGFLQIQFLSLYDPSTGVGGNVVITSHPGPTVGYSQVLFDHISVLSNVTWAGTSQATDSMLMIGRTNIFGTLNIGGLVFEMDYGQLSGTTTVTDVSGGSNTIFRWSRPQNIVIDGTINGNTLQLRDCFMGGSTITATGSHATVNSDSPSLPNAANKVILNSGAILSLQTASYSVKNDSGISGTSVKDALNTINSAIVSINSALAGKLNTAGGVLTGILTMNASIDMANNPIVNLALPSADRDASPKLYVDQQIASETVALEAYADLTSSVYLPVNTTSATLNFPTGSEAVGYRVLISSLPFDKEWIDTSAAILAATTDYTAIITNGAYTHTYTFTSGGSVPTAIDISNGLGALIVADSANNHLTNTEIGTTHLGFTNTVGNQTFTITGLNQGMTTFGGNPFIGFVNQIVQKDSFGNWNHSSTAGTVQGAAVLALDDTSNLYWFFNGGSWEQGNNSIAERAYVDAHSIPSPLEALASITTDNVGSPSTFVGNVSDNDQTNKKAVFGSTDTSISGNSTSLVYLQGGNLLGAASSGTPGNPGGVRIQGGGSFEAGNNVLGATVDISGGDGGVGGGNATMEGGDVTGAGTGSGGFVALSGGQAGSVSGDGGQILLQAGSSANPTGNGGNVLIQAGSSTGGTQGKTIINTSWSFDPNNTSFEPAPNIPALLLDVSTLGTNNGSVLIGIKDFIADISPADLYIQSGAQTAAGSTSNTGEIFIYSGPITDATSSGNTGQVILRSGENQGTGGSSGVFINSGNTQSGQTGPVIIQSGQVQTGSNSSGDVTFSSGFIAGTGNSGGVNLVTGDSNNGGNSGNINLQPGSAVSGVRGSVVANGRVALVNVDQTIAAAGIIDSSMSFNRIQAAGSVSTDPSTPIASGTHIGQVLVLANVGSNPITIKSGGNTELPGLTDFVLTTLSTISFIWTGSAWFTTSSSIN